ncbi:flavin reductase family protein [Azovibrio restrictus]|uniref:flavin reductase family protein n=1 Tax=Azovibrio restrictus TaxID=146938 RepID=UPI0004210010|nr:flavin reductase family protein [Azovibrio restrictus]
MRVAVPLEQAYKLLNHGPVTLVSAAHGGQANVMAASWAMPLDFAPPRVALVVDKSAYTRELLLAAGGFVLGIPGRKLAQAVVQVGSCCGREVDKFAAFGLEWQPGSQVAAPLVQGCAAWLECRLMPEPANQENYDLFLGEVLAAWADDQAWRDGRWVFADPELRTLHYVAGGQFFLTGESLVVDAAH